MHLDPETAISGATNRAAGGLRPQPDPIPCGCGLLRMWRIWPDTASKHYGNHPPRWAQPRVNPCNDCKGETREDPQAAAFFDSRQRRAGIGMKDRRWRWESTTVQKPRETPAAFIDRVRDSGRIGVLRRNVNAAQEIASWTPDRGYSIYIYGKTGSGKTVYASATASRLLTAETKGERRISLEELTGAPGAPIPEQPGAVGRGYSPDIARKMIEMGRDRAFRGTGRAFSVMACAENELYERVKLGWSRDRAPLAKVTKVEALILDDLGEVGTDPILKQTQPPGAAEGIQRLIRDRYASGKHLIITSNIPFEAVKSGGDVILSGIAEWYGDRVASRLAEMCGTHVYSLGNLDWRDQ